MIVVMPKNDRVMMMRVVVMVSMCYEVVLSFSPTHNEHIEDIYPSGAQIK